MVRSVSWLGRVAVVGVAAVALALSGQVANAGGSAVAADPHAPVGADPSAPVVQGQAFRMLPGAAPATGTITFHESDRGVSSSLLMRQVAVAAGDPPNTSIPFTSTYYVERTLRSGKRFLGGSTQKVCAHATGYADDNLYIALSTDGSRLSAIRFPQNGTEYGYCWTGLNAAYVYHFEFDHTPPNVGYSSGDFRATRT